MVEVADGEGLDGEASEGFAGGRGVEEGERGGGEFGEGAGVLERVAFAAADGAIAGKVGGGEDEDAGLGGAHGRGRDRRDAMAARRQGRNRRGARGAARVDAKL